MIKDALWDFGNKTTTASGNFPTTVDAEVPVDIGTGEAVDVAITFGADSAGGTSTLFELEADDNSGFSSPQTIAAIELPIADQKAGKTYTARIAQGAGKFRYYRLVATQTGAFTTFNARGAIMFGGANVADQEPSVRSI